MSDPADSFDFLRELIAAEYPDRLSLFDQCMHRFRRLSPDDDLFQFLIATGFITLILRSVPERVSTVLSGYEARLWVSMESAQAAVDRQTVELVNVVRRLETAVAAQEATTLRHKMSVSASHPALLIAVFVIASLLGGLVGYFYAQVH